MGTPLPFWAGKDAKIVFVLNEDRITLKHVDWEVRALGVDVEDQIGGEDRARYDTIVDGYSVTINAKQQTTELLEAFIKDHEAKDAREAPQESAVGFLIYPRDGTRKAFEGREYTLGLWGVNSPGRTERNTASVPGKCRYFKQVASV